jgi:hypothetical protein
MSAVPVGEAYRLRSARVGCFIKRYSILSMGRLGILVSRCVRVAGTRRAIEEELRDLG